MVLLGAVIAAGLAIAAFAVWFMSKKDKGKLACEGNLREKSVLPPGSMGLPFIGETLQYLSPFKSSNVGPFLHKRISRYGDVFKTHIFGQPTIITSGVETNQFVFQNEGRLFKCAYPDSLVSILGKKTLLEIHGPMHLKLRRLILSLVGIENLKANLLQDVEKQVIESLDTWEEGNIIQLKDETEKITFNLIMKELISLDSGTSESQNLLKSYSHFMAGLISVPIKIPGTSYSKCLKGREQVLSALKIVISERRKEKRIVKQDFLDQVLEKADENEEQFNDQVVLDFLFGFLYAGHDTTSIAMTLAVKYLTETPRALHELREEHETILREKRRKGSELFITWEDYKSMAFTRNVINETLRLSNVGPFVFRECIQETEIKGYRVPKGWKVVACTIAVNLDPSIHFEPLTFNPWRWQECTSNGNNFQAFGGGLRSCLGSELAKLEMGVFLHHLVTKFRWEKASGCKEAIVRCPSVVFQNGYPINLIKRIESSPRFACCSA